MAGAGAHQSLRPLPPAPALQAPHTLLPPLQSASIGGTLRTRPRTAPLDGSRHPQARPSGQGRPRPRPRPGGASHLGAHLILFRKVSCRERSGWEEQHTGLSRRPSLRGHQAKAPPLANNFAAFGIANLEIGTSKCNKRCTHSQSIVWVRHSPNPGLVRPLAVGASIAAPVNMASDEPSDGGDAKAKVGAAAPALIRRVSAQQRPPAHHPRPARPPPPARSAARCSTRCRPRRSRA